MLAVMGAAAAHQEPSAVREQMDAALISAVRTAVVAEADVLPDHTSAVTLIVFRMVRCVAPALAIQTSTAPMARYALLMVAANNRPAAEEAEAEVVEAAVRRGHIVVATHTVRPMVRCVALALGDLKPIALRTTCARPMAAVLNRAAAEVAGAVAPGEAALLTPTDVATHIAHPMERCVVRALDGPRPTAPLIRSAPQMDVAGARAER